MMVVLETHVVTQLTVDVVVAAISSSHVYRRTFVEWVALLLLSRCTFILFFQCSAKCHSEHTHSEWCQTVLPLAYTRTDCEEETLQPFKRKRKKNEKAHTQFRMYFAVLREYCPRFYWFFCVHSLSGFCCSALCWCFVHGYICIISVYFEKLSFGFCWMHYEVYLFISGFL